MGSFNYDNFFKENYEKYKNNYYDKNNKLDIEILKNKINDEIQKSNNWIKNKIDRLKSARIQDGLHMYNHTIANDYSIRDEIDVLLPDKITLLEVMKEILDNYEEEKKEFIEKINHNKIKEFNYKNIIFIISSLLFLSIIY
jgi:uncharacterized protein YbaR (Trm112 family)